MSTTNSTPTTKLLRMLAKSVGCAAGVLAVPAVVLQAQEAPTGFELPNESDVHPISMSSLCSEDEKLVLRVYGSARNAGRDDLDSHIYLYEPPLRLRLNAEGEVEVEESEQGVVVYLEGAVGSRIRDRILKCLAHELGRPLARAQLRPLQFRSILLTEAGFTSRWRSSVPLDRRTIPAAIQPWHRFEFRRLRTDMDPGQFADRLRRTEAVFNVVLSYSGQIGVESSVEIRTTDLLNTDFVRDLQGDGSAQLVTRSQLQEAGAQAFQEIRRTTYRELDLEPPTFDWLEEVWPTERISWGNFLSARLGDLSRYGFNEDDLSPDKITSFLEHVNRQMEDEGKSTIDIDTSFSAEAGFFGISGGAEGSLSFAKDDFRRRMESSEHQVEWTGERFDPRTIEVYVINENALRRDQRIYDRTVRSDPGDAVISFTLEVRPAEESPRSAVTSVVAEDQEEVEESTDLPAASDLPPQCDGCSTTIVEVDGKRVWQVELSSPVGARWGRWTGPRYCDDGSYIDGLEQRVEGRQGGDRDDAGLTGIRFRCSSPLRPDEGNWVELFIPDVVSSWGAWTGAAHCPSGSYIRGLEQRSVPWLGGGGGGRRGSTDDVGATGIRFFCNLATMGVQELPSPLPRDGSWGNWSGPAYCPDGSYLWGVEQRVEPSQGSDGDDTGLTGVRFYCSQGPSQ